MKKISNKYRHLIWPLASLALLLIYNAIFTEGFFNISIRKEDKSSAQTQDANAQKPAAQTQDANAQKPAEQTQDANAQKPAEQVAEQQIAEQPAEQVAEQIAEQPVEQAAEQVAEQPAEQPAEQVAEQVAEQPAEQPVEQVAEQPAEQVAEQPAEQPAAQAAEQTAEQPAEQVAEQVAEQPAEPAEQVAEQPAEPAEQVAEQPAEQVAEQAKEQPAEQAAEQTAEQTQPEVKQTEAVAQQSADQAQAKDDDGGVSLFGYYLYGTPIDILKQGSEVMILAIGMTLVIATGGIDISVGAVMAIAGAVAALLTDMFEKGQLPGGSDGPGLWIVIPVVAGLLLATLCGFWNGLLVAGCGIQPMVATLVLMVSGRGMAQLITAIGRSKPEQITFQSEQLAFLRNGHVLLLPCCLWIVVVMYIIAGILTRKTALGLFVESVGNNERASRYAGIEAKRIKWLAYVICGFCAGVAGLLTLSNTKSIDANNAGLYLELDAILATVIGGTSMAGGRFFLSGSLIGAVLIQTLTTTMYAKNVSPAVIPLPKAMVVIIVCLLQSPVFRAKVFSLFASKSAKGGVQ